MTQDQVIAAACEARIGVMNERLGFVVFNDVSSKHLERFYAIAYRQGMERAAEICEGNVAGVIDQMDWAREHCAESIRAEAHTQNQPKTTHDGSVV